MSPRRVETDVDGRTLSLTNLDKVLYPAARFTKGQVLDYYARMADVMLPHLAGRPCTFKRFPDGVDGSFFYEKHAPAHAPEWLKTMDVPRSRTSDEPITYSVIADRATLIWAANLATIEFHVPMWRAGRQKVLPARPDLMVFDLDPGPGTSIVECCRVARWVADMLGEDAVVPKTSGSKGLQLYTRVRRVTSDASTERAHEIARSIEAAHRDAVVSNMRKDLRVGKVLIDWSQNNPMKTTVAAYSLRAMPQPTVSTPVTWHEVDACAKSEDPITLTFTASDVLERVESMGDLMANLV